ncbi:Uncharacterized protein TPAR_03833 [Tolypocladium paradoxum]|uniref:Endoplasmic reticulum junction formation protein lunapark n=1 Tax=Tolypocladium paradoxum TaxID=94208 RepID=A0A2S4L0N3_9HYPO|nr:Uncharacterized protein TPAR_03833 [Tolypocladium paradoxum]
MHQLAHETPSSPLCFYFSALRPSSFTWRSSSEPAKMVSFWPWKGDSSSTASFEKTLSTLSAKIADTQSRLERMRASARRVKVLWTLYLAFAYTVYAIVLLLVVGYNNLGAAEWTGMAGGPVLIYVTRRLVTAYFNFRVGSLAARLKEQQEERAKTIQKLKDATKYDSTMELIEKYGGAEGKPKNKQDGQGDGQGKKPTQGGSAKGTPARTTMPPPPTANIQRLDGPPGTPSTPQPQQSSPLPPPPTNPLDPSAEFAPNAFSNPPLSSAPYTTQPSTAAPESHWYDRIFDVLLGEDETAPKNRIALICRACRLVNGRAPPGTRSLAELGVWRCMACGAANGEAEDEGKRIVREVLAAADDDAKQDEGIEAPEDDGEGGDAAEGVLDGPAAGLRARRGKGNK